MMRHTTHSKQQQGFTIVELMIATSVLAVILLFVSVMMINIGNLYYKAVSQTRIQNATRSVVSSVSENLELSSGSLIAPTPVNGVGAYCIGGVRYSFVLGRKLGTDDTADPSVTTPHVLWRDTLTGGGCSIPSDFTAPTPSGGTNGVEMMPANTRLTSFVVEGVSPYSITISAAFGDQDLLSATTGYDAHCNGGAGQQFCSVAKQQTTVARRLGE